jgi:hypothetical protein
VLVYIFLEILSLETMGNGGKEGGERKGKKKFPAAIGRGTKEQ